ncbi:MAG: hypothetical protein J3R72DRAFT_453237 [Linnemannia gamsii]|nr:MAG: hypothetical protein J3R72DRAFT_453237 [Linnemannia gamsii]
MILCPIILSRVGLFLDIDPLQNCVAVCKQWKEIFTPLLWHTFDEMSWQDMTKDVSFSKHPLGPQEEMVRRVQEHKGLIRNLTLSSYRILYAARMAGLTGLTSVMFDYPMYMSTEDYHNSDKSHFLSISEALVKVAEDNWFDNDVPEDLFEPMVKCKDVMNLTRGYWRLVLMNPGLKRLTFMIQDPMYILPLAVVKPPIGPKSLKPPRPVVLTTRSLVFLTKLLPTLSAMTHLEVGQNADEFLFSHIMTLPNLKCFTHSEHSQLDPVSLLKQRHSNLQNLVFRIAELTAVQLRAIVVAFPVLQSLAIPTCSITDEELIEADLWQELVHPVLTTFSVDDLSGPVQCRLKFPNVKTLYCAIFPSTNLALQRLLNTFPMTCHLEARRAETNSNETRDQDEEFSLQSENQIPRLCMVTSLVGWNSWSPSNRIDRVFRQMDFLVRLDVGWIGPRVLKEIGKVCSKLEYAKFDLHEICSRELVGLFVGCPQLKECRGRGHELLADDIIGSAEWTCLGIKVLEIDVIGVLRLGYEQESRLNAWRDLGSTELTNDEQDAFELQLFSYDIQRQVYERLGRLKELEVLFMGQHSSPQGRVYDTEQGEILPVGLELTLASGLAELGGMEKLQKIRFDRQHGRESLEDEVRVWMWDRWSMVEGWEYGMYTFSRQV